jgi:hypothetical protein
MTYHVIVGLSSITDLYAPHSTYPNDRQNIGILLRSQITVAKVAATLPVVHTKLDNTEHL